ncbi:DUF4245 domain-containing protein [Peterkaempfera bronchialis]|uniref:DUF4245 domain-containing protein n=1 Tax=Peterkaempfera bronchialis TaxID=2126346 RepID=A0A345SZU1_9ACTN|nr:DUF4245 domain-containing protein [Peterkaempfera bronchialis]AXI79246.1 DUF4245 domain-containing protein [Peterkaempfera bronchialis]
MGHHGGVASDTKTQRGRQTVRDMILSLLVVGGVAAVVYIFIPHSEGDPVRTVPYTVELATARRAAPYPVLAPQGLPAQWRATSVRYSADDGGHATWHLGFVTPSGSYAAVEQSDDSADGVLRAQVKGGKPDGSASVGGEDWDRYQGEPYRALVRESGGATTVVTGSASYRELAQLAQALHG